MTEEREMQMARRTIEHVATRFNIFFFFVMAMLGALLFAGGLFGVEADPQRAENAVNSIPLPVLFCCIGGIGFALFFPWFTALYFARYFLRALRRVEQENEELRKQLIEIDEPSV